MRTAASLRHPKRFNSPPESVVLGKEKLEHLLDLKPEILAIVRAFPFNSMKFAANDISRTVYGQNLHSPDHFGPGGMCYDIAERIRECLRKGGIDSYIVLSEKAYNVLCEKEGDERRIHGKHTFLVVPVEIHQEKNYVLLDEDLMPEFPIFSLSNRTASDVKGVKSPGGFAIDPLLESRQSTTDRIVKPTFRLSLFGKDGSVISRSFFNPDFEIKYPHHAWPHYRSRIGEYMIRYREVDGLITGYLTVDVKRKVIVTLIRDETIGRMLEKHTYECMPPSSAFKAVEEWCHRFQIDGRAINNAITLIAENSNFVRSHFWRGKDPISGECSWYKAKYQ